MKKIRIFLVALLASSQVFAATTSQWIPVVAVGGGFSNTINLGSSNNFPINNPNQDEYYNYSADHKSQTSNLLEAFLGVEHLLSAQWLLQIGGAYTQSGTYYPQGGLVQGADVQSENNYDYQLSLVTRQIMLQTKFMRIMRDHFYPYVLLGLGAAVNTASNFTTTVPNGLSLTRLYADNTSTTTFAYRLGIGLDADIGENLRLGIAYRIANLGGFSLGQATIGQDNVNGTLTQSAIYANEVLAELTFHF